MKMGGNKKILGVRLLNINGFRKDKYAYIENLFFGKENEVNIVCLIETMHKYDKIKLGSGLKSFSTMRGKDGKKGGGIMVLIPDMEEIKLHKKENKCTELLDLEGEIFGIGIKIIVVYFDANKGKDGNEANKEIRAEVEKLIETNKKEGLIVLGDFNGHLTLLDGRKEDINGKMLGKWIEDYSMVMLNMDEKCKGVYTFSRGDSKTTIDYVMVNKRMYSMFENM